MKKIGVIFGGSSPEYQVSLSSSVSVLKGLENLDYCIVKIGITKKGEWFLFNGSINQIKNDTWQSGNFCEPILPDFNKKGFYLISEKRWLEIDVLFPVLHGAFGEDGSIQGLFKMMNIAYVGCGVTTSSICMNKWILHQYSERIGISSTPTFCLPTDMFENDALNSFITEYGFPLFVKPNEAGSSKGINKVLNMTEMRTAISEAKKYDKNVLIQKSVIGTEIGCGIIGNTTLTTGACDEIELNSDFFDFIEKYQLVTSNIHTPARITDKTSISIKETAMKLYQFLGCKGLARMDFFLTETGEILLNEVNTMPGFTAHSRFPKMMAAIGMEYTDLLQRLILLAEEDYNGR